MKKLIYLFLTVLIVACSGEDGSNNQDNNDGDNNNITCEYSLTTLDAVVMPHLITLNGNINLISESCEYPIIEQGFVYSSSIQPTINDQIANANGIEITASISDVVPNTTYYVRTFLTNALGEFYGNETSFVVGNGIIAGSWRLMNDTFPAFGLEGCSPNSFMELTPYQNYPNQGDGFIRAICDNGSTDLPVQWYGNSLANATMFIQAQGISWEVDVVFNGPDTLVFDFVGFTYTFTRF